MPELTRMSISLEIQSRLEQVRLMRAAISGVLEHLMVVEDDIQSLVLAVSEIVNNSIEHGYCGADGETVRVQIDIEGRQVRIDIVDHAPEFPKDQRYRLQKDADSLPEPDEEWPLRGHGLQIVQQIVDSISLKYQGGENILTVMRRVSLKQA